MNLEDKLGEVRAEYLRRADRGEGALLREVEHYATARSGKMLRPRMLLAAAATLGEEVFASRRTLLMAVCVEMLHNASLLHDDVIDHAVQRRGQPSVNARWSNSVAVIAGDHLLAQVMQLLDEADDRDATRLINRTVVAMTESELLQQESMSLTHRLDDPTTYLRIIDGKTARLFATASALGNPAYEDFGLHYGRLFQLRDDMADGEDNSFTQQLIVQEEKILEAMPLRLTLQ